MTYLFTGFVIWEALHSSPSEFFGFWTPLVVAGVLMYVWAAARTPLIRIDLGSDCVSYTHRVGRPREWPLSETSRAVERCIPIQSFPSRREQLRAVRPSGDGFGRLFTLDHLGRLCLRVTPVSWPPMIYRSRFTIADSLPMVTRQRSQLQISRSDTRVCSRDGCSSRRLDRSDMSPWLSEGLFSWSYSSLSSTLPLAPIERLAN